MRSCNRETRKRRTAHAVGRRGLLGGHRSALATPRACSDIASEHAEGQAAQDFLHDWMPGMLPNSSDYGA